MVKVATYKGLLFPVRKDRNQSLRPEDIIELNIQQMPVKRGQSSKTIVSSRGNSLTLTGTRTPVEVKNIMVAHATHEQIRRLNSLIGQAVAIRDWHHEIIGGVLTEVTPDPTTKFQATVEKTNLGITVNSDYPAITPTTELRRLAFNIVDLSD